MNEVTALAEPKDRQRAKHPGNGLTALSTTAAREACNDLAATLANVGGSAEGLIDTDAVERLEEVGPNEIAREKPPHWLIQLIACFKNPFILVLVVLAIIQYVTNPDDLRPVIIVSVMVAISVGLQFWQEYRSALAAEKLKALVRTTATVLRRPSADAQAEPREVPIAELVPGDLVRLSAGDLVPADVRLIASRDLFVSQSALTGEALPVEKLDTAAAAMEKPASGAGAGSAGVLDCSNICFLGTNVVSGTATAVVIATGARTYFGSLAKAIVGKRAQTSFERGVNSVSWVLIRFMLIMVPVVFVINGFTKGDWLQAFLFAVSVAVGLTPEMLPMLVSANLAKGAIAMAKRKVVVKRLNAIQNFGAMDILCTDKTGTLTQDRIILEHHIDVSGKEDIDVLDLAWINSHDQSGLKNLLDVAVIKFAREHRGVRAPQFYKKVDELPFDFVRRRMSVIIEDIHGNHVLVCKGAVEETLAISAFVRSGKELVPLDNAKRRELMAMTREYNEDGFRVIGVATRQFPRGATKAQYTMSDEQQLVLRGFLAFLDPPKETAGPAIAALRDHGIQIKILTGDNPVVTRKVCRDVGLEIGTPVLGRDIEDLDDTKLRDLVEQTTVFAKVSPLQKARIIKTLQANGHTVGFLGDGINDAAALRDADVGVSVDTAADIAKESADIILLEKSLLVLEQGVITGRETFGNIIKYFKMTASSNFGNMFSVLVASAFLPFLPMMPLHLVILDLLYHLSQVAIPWDRMDKEYLQQPRKWDASDIARFMIWIGPISSIFDITTYCLMWFVFGANSPEHQSLFQSGWFIESLLSQTLIVHMIRTHKIPFIQSAASPPVLLVTAAVMAIGIFFPFSPLGASVGMQPLPLSYFAWLFVTLLSYCVLAQVIKTIYI
ncbi:MAG: magnesium-translocating P-type ATPase, partial [Hyphomicrobiales bacterium]|nr:magnesium-translocating P-type ATPase [Hyphomicrobiales bacterium]